MSALPRVALLNPPGRELYIRDYYCSKVSKTGYLYHPTDLLTASGVLDGAAEMMVLDAIAERLSVEESLRRLEAFAPDVVLLLSGAVSFHEDRDFAIALQKRRPCRILVSGDLFMEDGAGLLAEHSWMDAILTDFTTPALVDYVQGKPGPLPGFLHRGLAPPGPIRAPGYQIPRPRHDLFPVDRYRYPFVRRRPFATMLTDYGCPYPCTFCIQSEVGFKLRSVDSVMGELDWLAGQGYREIYFTDQTFAVRKDRTLELCGRMAKASWKMGWVCFSRADVVDEERLASMKAAGCHTVMFGIESGSDAVLDHYQKKLGVADIRDALARCRRMGLRTVGTFLIGLPEENEAQIRQTIDLACELPLDYASFNIPVPRKMTGLRKEAIALGLVDAATTRMDQSGKSMVVMGTKHLTAAQVHGLRKEALQRFYLRPGYLLRRLAMLRTPYEVGVNVTEGWSLVKDALGKG